jgi:thioredoxin reductase
MKPFDVIIIGGGPAGLSAALVLGRCRRKVLVCDDEKPRNAVSKGVNGFLSRDGIAPFELRRIAREQLTPYDTVSLCATTVIAARREGDGFNIEFDNGQHAQARKLIIATGFNVNFPDVPGLSEWYGKGVFDCPYCDGWEQRDKVIGVYGRGKAGKNFVLELLNWSHDIMLFSHGPHGLTGDELHELNAWNIRIVTEKIAVLEGEKEHLKAIRLENGQSIACEALFFCHGEAKLSPLIDQLNIEYTHEGKAWTNSKEETCIPGVCVVGDASKDVHFAIMAAAEGAKAAYAMNNELCSEQIFAARQ